MVKIKTNKELHISPCGTNLSIENNITDVELLKSKSNTQMIKVRFSDDGGNTYDVWMMKSIVDRLGDML
jgi:hypothetical protein